MPEAIFLFEVRFTHFHKGFGFSGARDDAPVVIGQHHYWPSLQIRAKNRFTGRIESVHITQCKHGQLALVSPVGVKNCIMITVN